MNNLSELIERIYAAAIEPATWPSVLTDVGRAVSNGTQTLLFLPGRDHLPDVVRCQQTPDSVLIPFLDYYHSVNVLAEPCDRIFAEGAVRYSHLAIEDRKFEHTEFYTDFFRLNGLFYSCGIKHGASEDGAAYLSMQREKSLQPFAPSETAVLQMLMPHIRRALNMQAQFTAQADQIHSAQTALAAFGKAVLAVNNHGKVCFATAAAEALLAEANPLFISGGQLHTKDRVVEEQLQRRLKAVLGLTPDFVRSYAEALIVPQNRGFNESRRLADNSHTNAACLKLVFLPMRHPGLFANDMPGVLITISGGAVDRFGISVTHEAILRELFGLTPIEGRIAELLLNGCELKHIADVLGKTVVATRFHLKQVFKKTGMSRQAELIRLLLNLPKA